MNASRPTRRSIRQAARPAAATLTAGSAAAPAREQLERLRQLGFFRDFTLGELRQLLRGGACRRYEGGEFLATEGTRKQRRVLYVVLEGQLEYLRHVRGEQTNVVLRLSPGDVGGFLTFFNDAPSPVSVRSAAPSEVLEIGRPEFERLRLRSPELSAKVLFALLRVTTGHTEALLDRVSAVAAWVLDLEHQVRQLPFLNG